MMNFSKMTIEQISLYLRENEPDHILIAQLNTDSRVGVRRLAEAVLAKRKAAQMEADRLYALQKYERQARENGYTYIAGVDEAGRGPLAGPVMAAAVILPEQFHLPGLNDSKKVSPPKRDELYEAIKNTAVAWSVGIGKVDEIDTYNILNATKIAMKRALLGLSIEPDYALLDALELEGLSYPQQGITGGDRLSASIAAASIIAKVTRDRFMQNLDDTYPGYGFAEHKGYPTSSHRRAIAELGASPVHRQSFMLLADGDSA